MNFKIRRQTCPRFLNLTSLIDVVFNLLLFFMVTTSFNRATEITLDLPGAESGQPVQDHPDIQVTIDAQGHYSLGEHAISGEDLATLRSALRDAVETMLTSTANSSGSKTSTFSEVVIVINADGQASHQSVVTVLDAARQLGLNHITFATQQPSSENNLTEYSSTKKP